MYTGLPQAGTQASPPQPAQGLHSRLSELAQRIGSTIRALDTLLARANGPKPTDSAPNKDAREPSTTEWVDHCHQGMNQIEKRLVELAQAIG